MKPLIPLFAAAGGSTLTGLDWLAIACYFGILLCVAWWVIKRRKDNAADYFLAGRNLGWWVIGASIFASNIGSEHIVGLAGSGAKDGVALAHYELHAFDGVHDARIPRTAIQPQLALRALDLLSTHLHCL